MIAEVIRSQFIKPMHVPKLLTQVPTVCIENVFVWNNTTVLADEVLAHRIGLVPLNIDPKSN
jgi:DNA-directed RNA polymerase alpha subunit